MNAQVLTVLPKGKIALPIGIRELFSIDAGDKLVAYSSGDAIMLKPLKQPSSVEVFEKTMEEAQEWAQSVGYQLSDVDDVIKTVRARKRI